MKHLTKTDFARLLLKDFQNMATQLQPWEKDLLRRVSNAGPEKPTTPTSASTCESAGLEAPHPLRELPG